MNVRLQPAELKEFLDIKTEQYNSPEFIITDPIQIPHRFSAKEDIEIIAFLVASIAWGNRKSIISSGNKIAELMNNSPFDFVMNHTQKDLEKITGFVHRTFNETDLTFFIRSLKNIYLHHEGLETVFAKNIQNRSLQPAIHEFKKVFFSIPHPARTAKHVSDPMKNSAAKRINMFLRVIRVVYIQ